MVNTAQSQPDYVQDRTSDIKNSNHFSCRYVYNSLLESSRYANEISFSIEIHGKNGFMIVVFLNLLFQV